MLLIFSILVIVYFRILKDSLRDVKKTSYLNNKVSKLNKLSFIGSLYIMIQILMLKLLLIRCILY